MGGNSRNRIIIIVSLFTALTAIGAYIKIPLPHIPVTLQTFFVIMSGNVLGFKLGSISQVLYLCVGLIGIPIFAYGGGPGYIFQPTFGYLLGYPACAFMIGVLLKLFFSRSNKRIRSKQQIFFTYFLADMLGILVIFVFGLAYLYFNLKMGLYLRLDQFAAANFNWLDSLKAVLFIFVPIDIVKAFVASWFMIYLKQAKIDFTGFR